MVNKLPYRIQIVNLFKCYSVNKLYVILCLSGLLYLNSSRTESQVFPKQKVDQIQGFLVSELPLFYPIPYYSCYKFTIDTNEVKFLKCSFKLDLLLNSPLLYRQICVLFSIIIHISAWAFQKLGSLVIPRRLQTSHDRLAQIKLTIPIKLLNIQA